jgi:hypothetical protein
VQVEAEMPVPTTHPQTSPAPADRSLGLDTHSGGRPVAGVLEASMAKVSYPTTCLSAYCGKICCDGCRNRPILAAWHRRNGDAEGYEQRQAEARVLTAKWDAEWKERCAAADAALGL